MGVYRLLEIKRGRHVYNHADLFVDLPKLCVETRLIGLYELLLYPISFDGARNHACVDVCCSLAFCGFPFLM